MSSATAQPFDRVAERYDDVWTDTAVGRLQRKAVWRNMDGVFPGGSRVLDLGCGTGEDAIHFQGLGLAVTAIDASPAMVARARTRGVNARVLAIEELDQLHGRFDGAISNFGALNCIGALDGVGASLGRLILSGGYFGVCVMNRVCLWETLYFLARGSVRKAVRRWSGVAACKSLGMRVYYPTARDIRRALAPEFVQTRVIGIGVTVPPSFVSGVPKPILDAFDMLDRRIERLRIARAMADHTLLLFVRR